MSSEEPSPRRSCFTSDGREAEALLWTSSVVGAASQQQAANPQQICGAQQLDYGKQQRRLDAVSPADNRQHNVQPVSGGDTDAQADAAAQAIADGVAHQ